MRQFGYNFFFFLFLVLALTGCAKRGNINGGTKDTIAPVLKVSFPKNHSVNFNGREIKLVFDEYVKLKNVNKQLIVSPPMKTPPEITPQSASKTITIKIKDTLRSDTTYSFNFGQSIEDNNEGNPYPQFKYVFSTGNYIDSLSLRGVIKDAFEKDVENYVSVMLYEINDRFNDSIVYKENPRYITNTLDSLKSFELENLKAGKYLLVAMKDYNNNFKFDPKKDKIAFHKQYVTVPNDTLYELELFKEKAPFKVLKPTIASPNHFYMGYTGEPENTQVVIKHNNDIVPSILTRLSEKDSLNIWHQPVKADSLLVSLSKGGYKEEFWVKLKSAKKDSLAFSASRQGVLPLREDFIVNASRPLLKFDNSLMKLTKDSISVSFTTVYDEFNQQLKFVFQNEPMSKYRLQLLPGAMTDFYEQTNDTLNYRFETKNTTDYGNLRINLQNVKRFPIIIELTDGKGKLQASNYSTQATQIDFNGLDPDKYTLRIIYDDNGNKIWDTGNYLEKRQSEEVIYFPSAIDVRANWDVDQTFSLP